MTIIYKNIYHIKRAWGLLCAVIILCSCYGLKSGPVTTGCLTGYIYLLSGNQMPSPGKQPDKGRGVSREIYIYEPASIHQTQGASPLFDQIKTRLITTTKSDSAGHYAVKLPAGRYSVFIKDNGRFFAAESDGGGILNPVEIIAKTVTRKDFKITTNAAY